MKLAKMSAVPTADDLSFALSLAVKNPKNIVELPWKSANSPNSYIIKVTCSQSLEEPTWFLHVGGDEDQPVLWNYDTADATLIHSLVTAECERTTYTAPLDQEITSFPVEVQLASLPGNGGPEPYLPREHEQPIPSFSSAAGRPAFDTSLNWNDQSAPSSQHSSQPALQEPPTPFSALSQMTAPAPMPTPQMQKAPSPQPPFSPQLPEIPAPSATNQASQLMTNSDPSRSANVATATKPTLPAPIDLDRSAVDSMYKSFTNADTGFISHAAFLFFLVNEFNRYQKDPKPLSVVRFDLCIKPINSESTITPVPQRALKEAGKRIFSVMRPLDWVAHYEQEFAILMPFTARAEAGQLTQAIANAISVADLVPGLETKMVGISFGVASMPEDCSHPGILLAAAQDAKNRARKSGVPVMLFNDSN
jgi:diguanylate cyclase (GGDEF)-like protein